MEPLFNLEIFLSSERFQTKRDTIQLVSLLGAYGGFKNALSLVGGKLISDLSQKNFRSQLSNASSVNKLNNMVVKWYEVYMMAYLWSCCLVGKRFKKIKEAD